MKYVIAGTHRSGSKTLKVAEFIKSLYKDAGEEVELIDLAALTLGDLNGSFYGVTLPSMVQAAVDKVNSADGLHFVVPEYNGSMPGILKLFIDHWKFPESFEHRPVCFVGLGGMFGGLRPVEHLQQVMGYRNAFQFPDRVFFINVWNSFKDGQVQDALTLELLKSQIRGFQAFCQALKQSGIDANSLNSRRVIKK